VQDSARIPEAITELNSSELESLVLRQGGRPFQARQIEHWVFKHGVSTFSGCRNLPNSLGERLSDWGDVRSSNVVAEDKSTDGTSKLLVQLHDKQNTECVIIPDGARTTLCISTQVGCPVGCVFCASGLDGVRRNLTRGEIIEQYLHARERVPSDQHLTNLVVMGMGEPLLNLDSLLSALDRIHDPEGIGLGARRVTISTSGYPDRIARLAQEPHNYGLAISLHSADDDLRRQLIPASKDRVADLIKAARDWFKQKHREVTFEIVLLNGVNDRPQDAQILIQRLRGLPCTVNLIAWNPVDRITDLERPEPARVDAFAAQLRQSRINVTVRRSRGSDRSAACGQLRIREA